MRNRSVYDAERRAMREMDQLFEEIGNIVYLSAEAPVDSFDQEWVEEYHDVLLMQILDITESSIQALRRSYAIVGDANKQGKINKEFSKGIVSSIKKYV